MIKAGVNILLSFLCLDLHCHYYYYYFLLQMDFVLLTSELFLLYIFHRVARRLSV